METDSRLCKPSGDLTIFEAAEFKEALMAVLSNDGLVCLDLSQVGRVDTASMQLLWAARKLGRLLVTGISDELQTKLNRLGFSEPLSE
ncbi:MAG: STAS domain-containing protein [Nitrospira sp.]|nr:MAG: STAS domain-containing protein [Nitrospira sp.]